MLEKLIVYETKPAPQRWCRVTFDPAQVHGERWRRCACEGATRAGNSYSVHLPARSVLAEGSDQPDPPRRILLRDAVYFRALQHDPRSNRLLDGRPCVFGRHTKSALHRVHGWQWRDPPYPALSHRLLLAGVHAVDGVGHPVQYMAGRLAERGRLLFPGAVCDAVHHRRTRHEL